MRMKTFFFKPHCDWFELLLVKFCIHVQSEKSNCLRCKLNNLDQRRNEFQSESTGSSAYALNKDAFQAFINAKTTSI